MSVESYTEAEGRLDDLLERVERRERVGARKNASDDLELNRLQGQLRSQLQDIFWIRERSLYNLQAYHFLPRELLPVLLGTVKVQFDMLVQIVAKMMRPHSIRPLE